jgi:hypothetical protein
VAARKLQHVSLALEKPVWLAALTLCAGITLCGTVCGAVRLHAKPSNRIEAFVKTASPYCGPAEYRYFIVFLIVLCLQASA